ncbi:MAG: hypothetical protein LC794_20090 [Acidobacteria bacterium]|nr:hypothetical protein [Acidobacteriota bacterium]
MQNTALKSVITCPKCGFEREELMPTNACLFFYDCVNCNSRLRPLSGDCCVFCSFGNVKCPPKQQQTSPTNSQQLFSEDPMRRNES